MNERQIIPTGIFSITFFLIALNTGFILVFGLQKFEFDWATGPEIGFTCGLMACVFAAWTLYGGAGRPISALILILTLVAIVLTGPLVASILTFGLKNGLQFAYVSVAERGEPGLDGAGMMSPLMLFIAAVAVLAFASQAWAILQARDAWKRA